MPEIRLEPMSPAVEGVAGPLPAMRIRVIPQGREEDQPTTPLGASKFVLIGVETRLDLNGIRMPGVIVEDGFRFGEQLGAIFAREAKWLVPMPRYILEAIESGRLHDVQLSLNAEIRYWANDGQPRQFRSQYANFPYKISQFEWLGILKAVGYSDVWVLEVQRPSIEGWGKAKEFLDAAADRLASRDYIGAIAQCRAAWNAVEPSLSSASSSLATEIDTGSTPEQDYPSKSERIEDLHKCARAWANTGDHPESYAASPDDAFLAYRVSVSLLAYLSRKVVQSEARSPPAKVRK